jgi:Cof subfamily protein (haloacid dehalogenase superfamily)
VDGTLIDSDGVISPATLSEIRRVVRGGVHFSIASGRPTRGIRVALADLNIRVPVIGSNGAVVEDLNTGEVIHSANIEARVALRVLEAVAVRDTYWVLVDTAEGWSYQPGRLAHRGELERMVAELRAVRVDNWARYLEDERGVLKVVVHAEEPELKWLERELGEAPGVHVTSSWARNREITIAGADKANAARMLAARLGIEREDVLAIGDNRNDLELVEWAGVGVAMGNAVPELKRVADWVTSTNDEDGVAHALARFVP